MFEKIRQYYHSLLPSLDETSWTAAEHIFEVQEVKKGALISKQGLVCRQVSFINTGLLRLYYVADGREVSTAFMREGEYISQYDSFLTQTPAIGNIEAVEDAELINLSFDSMQRLYREHPVFEIFGRKIAEKLFLMACNQINTLLLQRPEERYQALIQQWPYLNDRVPQYMIASYIGVTAEHLSRLRRKLAGRENTLRDSQFLEEHTS